MHGYELRKRLSGVLGTFHAISYGSLYPCLKDLVARGWIVEDSDGRRPPALLSGKRARIVYRLTAEGKEHFQALIAEAGPDTWEDERFGVRLAFFGRTEASVRLRILEGRRVAARGAPRRARARRWPAPASASTATPSSCSSTGSRASSARCAGSTSSSPASATQPAASTTRSGPRRGSRRHHHVRGRDPPVRPRCLREESRWVRYE